MRRPAIPALLGALSLVLLVACQSSASRADLVENEALYRSPCYRSKLPGDRAVFIAPLKDEREAAGLPDAEGSFPIAYDSDGRWHRPMPVMVEELLVAELRDSLVFSEVLSNARSDGLVLIPTLVSLHSGLMEMMDGARSLADAAIRVQVYGPADAAGHRVLFLDEVYADRQVSETSVAPISTYHMVGRAVQRTMARVVSGLDSSNVSRSGVPLEAAANR